MHRDVTKTLLARFLAPRIKRGRLSITHASGLTETFGTSESTMADVHIRLRKKGVMRRIAADPDLGVAEAYMDGDLTLEQGDIWDLVTLYQANRRWEDRSPERKSAPKRALKKAGNYLLQANNQIRSKKNVAHHYDLGNDFYRLFLDEDMQYSCAYFTDPAMTLEAAQVAKKAHIAAKLALEPGQRVLDIGCGWGGMALYLNRVAGVRVHGITLSEEQFALAKQRANEAGVSDDVTFELVDYRDLAEREDQGFDRIVSVGMFEHVGQPNFETFFGACHKMLKSDGAMLMHTIGRFSGPGTTSSFTQKYIFPGGYIPALSETVAASEKARLMASDVETLRMHYGWTLRHWYDRTLAQREQIIAMYDERFFRMWTFYLAGAASAFEWGGMGNYQIQYLRSRRALPVTRDYIAEREAEYLAKG